MMEKGLKEVNVRGKRWEVEGNGFGFGGCGVVATQKKKRVRRREERQRRVEMDDSSEGLGTQLHGWHCTLCFYVSTWQIDKEIFLFNMVEYLYGLFIKTKYHNLKTAKNWSSWQDFIFNMPQVRVILIFLGWVKYKVFIKFKDFFYLRLDQGTTSSL